MSTLRPSVFRPRPGAGMLMSVVAVLAACGDPSARAPQEPAPVAAAADAPPSARRIPPATRPRDWSGPVTVARLVGAAEESHPSVAAIAAAQAATAAQVRQAGAWANPELGLSLGRTRPRVEDLGRDQPYGGSLSQRLEWWGKRDARVAAARARQQAAGAEAQVAILALRADVRRAAIAYAAAAEAVAQAEEEARIASGLAAMTEARLVAGEADRSSVARARLEAATATLHRDARRREAATALDVLRTWVDPDLPDGLAIADAFAASAVVADAAGLAAVAGRHPLLRALAEAASAAAAAVDAEREARLPDLTLGVFADREAEKDTFGVTLGIELPLWNRNEAGISAAEAVQAQARAQSRSERLRLARDLAEALGTVRTAHGEAEALAGQAIPAADEAIRLRTTAFAAGEASLSDLLEARRAVNAVQAELRSARLRAALALVDLGVAVGDPALGASAAFPP